MTGGTDMRGQSGPADSAAAKTGRRKLLKTLGLASALSPLFAQSSRASASNARVMGQIQKGYVDGPFGQIHFRRLGDGSPLILCHQGMTSSEMFMAAMRPLAARGIMAIAIDTPGYGMSDRPRHSASIEDYASIIGPVMDHFGLNSFSLFGHHTGAYIACHFAHQNPDRVRNVILGAPAVFHDENGAPFREFPPPVLPDVKRDGSHIMRLWERRLSYTRGRDDLDLAHRYFCTSLMNWDALFDGNMAALDYKIRPALESFKMPTMLLSGEADDQAVFHDMIRDIRPDFRFVTIPDASGYVVDEKTEEWVNHIVDFIT